MIHSLTRDMFKSINIPETHFNGHGQYVYANMTAESCSLVRRSVTKAIVGFSLIVLLKYNTVDPAKGFQPLYVLKQISSRHLWNCCVTYRATFIEKVRFHALGKIDAILISLHSLFWTAWCKTDVSDFFGWNFFFFKSAWIFACAFQFSSKTFPCIFLAVLHFVSEKNEFPFSILKILALLLKFYVAFGT